MCFWRGMMWDGKGVLQTVLAKTAISVALAASQRGCETDSELAGRERITEARGGSEAGGSGEGERVRVGAGAGGAGAEAEAVGGEGSAGAAGGLRKIYSFVRDS